MRVARPIAIPDSNDFMYIESSFSSLVIEIKRYKLNNMKSVAVECEKKVFAYTHAIVPNP
jgi:hypothetical protein